MIAPTPRVAAVVGFLWLVPFGPHQQPRDIPSRSASGTAAIVGHVVTDESSPQPVRRARVVLSAMSGSSAALSVTTDDAGAFTFAALPAGRYAIASSKPGWIDGHYGAKRPGRPGISLSVGDGESVAGLTIAMAHGAVVTGTVRDRRGQPMSGVIVTALRFGYSPLTGLRTAGTPTSSATQTSDDVGVYRIYGLPPGEYALLATYRPRGTAGRGSIRQLTTADVDRALLGQPATTSQPGNGPSSSQQRSSGSPLVSYAPVYFPGTTDASAAGTISFGLGEVRSGMDFIVPLVPTATIDGTVQMPAGVAPATVQLWLLSSTHATSSLGTSGTLSTTTRLDSEGKFRFPTVTPGPYTILARAAAPGVPGDSAPSSRGPAPAVLYAAADVDVTGDQSVTLDFQPGVTIAGRIAFDGASPFPSPADISTMRVSLAPVANTPALTVPPVTVDGQGAFRAVGVVPGTYRITYSRNTTGTFSPRWTLNSIVTRGADVFDSLTVRPHQDIDDLTFTFTDHPSELSGTLQDRAGRPAPDYFVIVFSADRVFWTPASRRVRELRPGTDGAFSITGLPAGDYYIGALTDVEDGEWYDRNFLEQLVPMASKIIIADGQKTVQTFRVGR